MPTPTALPFTSYKVSPDGQLIAGVVTAGDHKPGLYVMNFPGAGATFWTAVFDQPVSDYSWSPDSKRLAFLVPGSAFERTIAVVNSDGSNLIQLGTKGDPTGSVSSDGKPFAISISVIKFEWSSDGTAILFAAYYGGSGKVYVYSTDSTRNANAVRLNMLDLP